MQKTDHEIICPYCGEHGTAVQSDDEHIYEDENPFGYECGGEGCDFAISDGNLSFVMVAVPDGWHGETWDPETGETLEEHDGDGWPAGKPRGEALRPLLDWMEGAGSPPLRLVHRGYYLAIVIGISALGGMALMLSACLFLAKLLGGGL